MEAWNNKSSWTSVKRLLWIEKDQSYGNEMTKMKRLAKERRFLLISMMKMTRARWTGHSLWGFELSWIILKMNFVHGAVSLCIYVRIWGWYLKKTENILFSGALLNTVKVSSFCVWRIFSDPTTLPTFKFLWHALTATGISPIYDLIQITFVEFVTTRFRLVMTVFGSYKILLLFTIIVFTLQILVGVSFFHTFSHRFRYFFFFHNWN